MEVNDELDQFLLEVAEAEDQNSNQPQNLRDDNAFSAALDASSSTTPKPTVQSSVIHENGALDSSDDEDMKNFLERKYNEYGRDIQSKLKKQNEEQIDRIVTREVDQNIRKSTPKSNPTEFHFPKYNPKPITAASKPDNVGVYTDPIFGIRIIHPLISSTQLGERMVGRIAVPMSSLRKHLDHGDLSKDWAVAGAIVKKSAVLTSKKGAQYVIWTLSDLRGEIKTISLFLFKNAYKQLWKTAEGMVVAVLNPGVFDSKQGKGDEACLSVDNAQKFMVLGQSKDLGTCRSRKKNGDMCHAIVNLGACEYCVYHVKQEYSKMSGRSELQSASSGRGLDALRNKVLGKSEVFYGGQSFLAVPAKKNPKQIAKDQRRLQMLSEQNQSNQVLANKDSNRLAGLSTPENGMSMTVNYNKPATSKIAAGVDANISQRRKDLERLKQLEALHESQAENKTQKEAATAAPKPVITTTPTLSRSSFFN
ncbi:hypothetical protein HA402_000793 [Bradysia odoriphaga]|nr:hypothetical protein HA402_000793 [Bradysia odoriphaga]